MGLNGSNVGKSQYVWIGCGPLGSPGTPEERSIPDISDGAPARREASFPAPANGH